MGWAFLPPIQRALDTPIAPVTRPDLRSRPSCPCGGRRPSPGRSATPSSTRCPAASSTVTGPASGHPPTPPVRRPSSPCCRRRDPPRSSGRWSPIPLLWRVRPRPARSSDGVDADRVDDAPTAADLPDVVRPEAPAAELTRAPSVGMPVVHRSVVADAPAPAPVEVPDPVTDSAEPRDMEPAPDQPDQPDQPDVPDRPALGATSHESALPAVVQRSVAPTADPPKPTVGPRLGLGAPLGRPPRPPCPSRSPSPTAAPDAPQRFLRRRPHSWRSRTPDSPRCRSSGRSPPLAPATPAPAAITPRMPPPAELPAPALTLARSIDSGSAPPQPVSLTELADDPDLPAPRPTDVLEQPVVADDEPTPEPAIGATEGAEVTDVAEPVAADPPVAVEPPTLLPSTPLPLTGGLATSIQRADLLPGAGTPTPSLAVRPAPVVPVQRSRERVIPIQRVPAEPPSVESAHLRPAAAPSRRISERDGSAIPASVQRSLASVVPAPAAPAAPAGPATRDALGTQRDPSDIGLAAADPSPIAPPARSGPAHPARPRTPAGGRPNTN